MAAKPTTFPRWAETAGGSPAANITTPSSGEQDTGYTSNQIPTSGKLNWLFRFIYDWVLYLGDAILVANAGSTKDGVKATGDGTGAGGSFTGGATAPGVYAQAGGGGSPASGALALIAQATPSAPAAGHVWYDSAADALRARYFAATIWLSKWLYFSGLPGATASTTYYLAATAASVAAAATTSAMGATQYLVPAVRAISFGVRTSTTTVGGTITVQLWANGSQIGTSITLTAGSVAGWYTSALISGNGGVLTAGVLIELRIVNGSGVTTGVGQVVGFVEVA